MADDDTLDTIPKVTRHARLGGEIRGELRATFRARELESSTERFQTAISDGWPIVFGLVTSGAHGWQIHTPEDGAAQQLADAADPTDIQSIVFANGWLFTHGAQWVHDGDIAERIADIQDRRDRLNDELTATEQDALDADDRLRKHTFPDGREADGWWTFEETEFTARPDAAAAYARGYDDGRADDSEDDE